ncbi:MAG: hypothetical protein IKS12_04085 [Eubacterium sp.]|nr:hypothetical protein [Eubacterium sp.]
MKSNNRFSLRKIISNDKSLVIVVLILAVIIWTITSLNIGTDESRTIKVDVPISLSDQLSKQVGMNYYTLKDTVTINVTLSGAKYIIGQVSESDLNIKFDTSNVNRAGEQTIPILVTNKSKTKDFQIVSTYPSSVDAYFDVEETKTFDIELKYNEDAVADGYIFGTPSLSEDKVVVSGPTTYVDKIDSISADIDFPKDNSVTESYSEELTLNVNGSGVERSFLKFTSKTDSSAALSSVSVTLPVLKEATLPVSVDIENTPKGISSKDYSVSYSVRNIEAGVLENADVKSAVVGSIDFSELNIGRNVFEFDISNAQGFTSLNKAIKSVTVVVNIPDEFEKKVIAVNTDNIKITGGNGSEKVKSINKSTLVIITRKGTDITADNVKMQADISEKNNENTYPVEFTVSDSSSWIYGSYKVTIK